MDTPYKQWITQDKDSSFNALTGFKRTGLHHVTLKPGERSSDPHAESHEEEFVFVLSGHVDIWIDGYIYHLHPQCAAGFPAGTGIAHCLINNSQAIVELLVAGERTKPENRCTFPLNPERKDIPWENPPPRKLGPHNGRPGPVLAQDRGENWPAFLIDCTKQPQTTGFHYPGDSETFGSYARLTNILGLKALGIGYETLPPGKRTSFPHAHLLEEEFAFVVQGTPTVWMNGFLHDVPAGQGVAFPPGSGIAHTLINNTDEDVVYLVIGEAVDPDGKTDEIYYPKHPFRNEQCRKKNWLWLNPPLQPLGPHNGRPNRALEDHLAFRLAGVKDENTLLGIIQNSPEYFRRVEGCAPTIKTVRHTLLDEPKKKIDRYSKELLIIEWNDQPIGLAEIHIHHPEVGIVYIGLLLIREDLFGKGLGRRAFALLEHYVKLIFDASRLRLGVSDENDVTPFWTKLGFHANGHSYQWQGEAKVATVRELEKIIP